MIGILDASASRPPAPRIQTRRAAFPLRKLALATNIKAAIFVIPIWCRTKQLKLRLGGPGFGSPATTCRRPEDDHRAALTNPAHQPSACDDFKGGSGTTSRAIKSWSTSISMTTHPAIHGLMAGLIAGMSGSAGRITLKLFLDYRNQTECCGPIVALPIFINPIVTLTGHRMEQSSTHPLCHRAHIFSK